MSKNVCIIFIFSALVTLKSFPNLGTKNYLFSHSRCRNSQLPHFAKIWQDNFTFSHFMQGLKVKKINSLNPLFFKIKKFIEFRSLTAGD
jgi:hypothetical protein